MGHNTSSCLEKKYYQEKHTIPIFYYLNKESNSIIKFQDQSVSKFSLPNFKIFNDCAIGYLSEGHIVIAGGIKTSGRLSKKVYYINTTTKAINRLPSLQHPSSKGTLLHSDHTLYYFSQDLSMNHQYLLKNK